MSSDVNPVGGQNNPNKTGSDSEQAEKGIVHSASDGGLVASHTPVTTLPALVGPATADEFNTLRAAIVPVACFRLDDVRFAFNSSFVLPEAAQELNSLAALMAQHTNTGLPPARQHPPLSVFGHTDAAGSDEYNKTLSGRRAEAIYGLLTRKTAIWERLFTQPFHGDDWGNKSIQIMLNALLFDPGRQDGTMDASSQDALKAFQQANGLAPDGHVGGQTRQKLFRAYMDALCRCNVEQAGGEPFVVAPGQFLGEGADARGKGDYQGCGEFNPVLIFSQADTTRFAADKDKSERNAANAPNRRVLIFLFRPGTQIEPTKWPCPRAEEGPGGCRKRFWSDAARRRAPGLDARQYEETQDTFACRFYHRLADTSPCEQIVPELRIRLYDREGKLLIGAPFLAKTSRKEVSGVSDAQGDAVLRDMPVPTLCAIQWSRPKAVKAADRPSEEGDDRFEFHSTIYVDLSDSSPEKEEQAASAGMSPEGARRRLNNLGYQRGNMDERLKAFQRDCGVQTPSGRLQDSEGPLRDYHDQKIAPPRKAQNPHSDSAPPSDPNAEPNTKPTSELPASPDFAEKETKP